MKWFVTAILLLSVGFVFGFNDHSGLSKIDPVLVEAFKTQPEMEYLSNNEGKSERTKYGNICI